MAIDAAAPRGAAPGPIPSWSNDVQEPLNLFYEELPEADRWLPFDRYPRRIVRRIVRGKPSPGGQMRVFLNLRAGLDRLGVRYRVNDYRHMRRHPQELACIVGRPHVLDRFAWQGPILFGAAVFSHPTDDPNLLTRLKVRRILVPGEWMRRMCEPYWGAVVRAWPVGIDTDLWLPTADARKDIDFLVYDKVLWEHDRYARELIEPVMAELAGRGLGTAVLRYGHYREEDFHALLRRCKAMVFLCEHETQGIAYLQALSCGVPILAWDRGGYWRDPAYYPRRVQFAPVTSVPYWDGRCGSRFAGAEEFPDCLEAFLKRASGGEWAPRDYVLENLTLERCAQHYVEHARAAAEPCAGDGRS